MLQSHNIHTKFRENYTLGSKLGVGVDTHTHTHTNMIASTYFFVLEEGDHSLYRFSEQGMFHGIYQNMQTCYEAKMP